jgi:putative transcriptional regulator
LAQLPPVRKPGGDPKCKVQRKPNIENDEAGFVESIYLDYASGSLSPSARLLVAAHLALRPENQGSVTLWEQLGGCLLEAEAPSGQAPADQDFDFTAEEGASRPSITPAAATLPVPLAEVIGKPISDIDWISTLPGMKEYPVPGWPQARLVRLAAGRTIPRHSHGGLELTLVLEGAFSDASGLYQRGDICVADETVEHSPRVSPDRECLCFAVIEGPYRPKGVWRLISALNDLAQSFKPKGALQ